MIRILVIGKESVNWGQSLLQLAPTLVIDTARLPAAGVRQFLETPPDAICLLDVGNLSRTTSLVRSLRSQPLGEFIPIFVIFDFNSSGVDEEQVDTQLKRFDISNIFPQNVTPRRVLDKVEEELGFETGELEIDANSIITLQSEAQNLDPYDNHPQDQHSQAFSNLFDDERAFGSTKEHFAVPPNSFPRDKTRVSDAHLSNAELRNTTFNHESTTQNPQKRPTRIETSSYIIEQIIDKDEKAPKKPVQVPPIPSRKLSHPGQPGRSLMPALQGPVDAAAIRDMLRCVRKQPYHEILGLDPNQIRHSTQLVSQAHTFLSRRFDPQHVDLKYSRDYLDELFEIRDAVDDAYAVLSNERLREDYFRALSL